VEIKDDREAKLLETRERLISQLLGGQGSHFRLWKASKISGEPRLTNASIILRYRRAAVDPTERERIRRTFASSPKMLLGASQDAPHSMQRLNELLPHNWQPLVSPAEV
jgi:hypothetical protein